MLLQHYFWRMERPTIGTLVEELTGIVAEHGIKLEQIANRYLNAKVRRKTIEGNIRRQDASLTDFCGKQGTAFRDPVHDSTHEADWNKKFDAANNFRKGNKEYAEKDKGDKRDGKGKVDGSKTMMGPRGQRLDRVPPGGEQSRQKPQFQTLKSLYKRLQSTS